MDRLNSLVYDLCSELSDPKALVKQLDELPIKTEGLPQKQLKRLISFLTDPHTSASTALKVHVINNFLFFKDAVPSDCVYQIIGSIGAQSEISSEKRISPTLQNRLLTWIISVYPFLEDPNIVVSLYGILFNSLEFEFIRPRVAHLLFLSTKKRHITDYRIQELLDIYKKYETSEHIIGLLLLYQQYAPDKVFDTFGYVSSDVFAYPNDEYLQQLLALRKSPKRPITLNSAEEFGLKLKKRKGQSVGHLNYSSLFPSTETANNSIEDLVKNIDTFNIGKTWQTLRSDSTSTSLLLLAIKSDRSDDSRLDAWIGAVLSHESTDEKELLSILSIIKKYMGYTSTLPNQIQKELLLREERITDASPKLLEYVWFFIESLDVSSQIAQVVTLFDKIATKKDAAWYVRLIESLSISFHKLLLLSDRSSLVTTQIEEIFKLIIESLVSKIVHFDYDRSVVIASLGFISVLQLVNEEKLSVPLVVLPPTLVFIYLFISDPIAISELGAHLNFAKSVLRDAVPTDDVLKLTSLHNTYVVDICNIIWRNKAFDLPRNSNSNALGLSYQFFNELSNSVPIYDRNSNFKALFNIHHSTAFASYSAEILRKLEDKDPECVVRHEGPLTQPSTDQLLKNKNEKWLSIQYEEIRVEILKELENLGYVGLADVLFSHLKSILNKR